MTKEQIKLRNEIIIKILEKSPNNILNILTNLKDYQKTPEVCSQAVKLFHAENDNLINLLEQIPIESRSREIYEILLQKSNNFDIIKNLSNKNFDKNISQEEYEIWLDNIIIKKISEINDINQIILPREKVTERVWNTLIDKHIKTNKVTDNFTLSIVLIKNITLDMCKRALKDIGYNQIEHIPTIDKKTDLITNKKYRKEYTKWIEKFSEKEKEEYRQWHEKTIIDLIKKYPNISLSTNIEKKTPTTVIIPPETITVNIINTYLQEKGPNRINDILIPNEYKKYNELYENIILSAISILKKQEYQIKSKNYDILNNIPKEYITDKIILEAIKIHPKYLNYANPESKNFEELLQIAFKNKLNNIGRNALSEKEIQLIKKFAKNNSTLFSTLNFDILFTEVIDIIAENNLERIVRYPNIQDTIIELTKNKDTLIIFNFVLNNLNKNYLFIEPLIEKISLNIKNLKNTLNEGKTNQFLEIASTRIQDNSIQLTEEEKTIISYLVLNPEEENKIQNYNDILNFVSHKNTKLNEIINSQNLTLIDAKNAYFERFIGINYKNVIDLIKKYGNDPEQLLEKYEKRDLKTYKEQAEKEALEIIINLKSLIKENDLNTIKQEYQKSLNLEDATKSFERYKYSTVLNHTLKRAYGRDLSQSLNKGDKENYTETIQYRKDGQKYIVRKINSPFNRMVSVLNAYKKNKAIKESNIYKRWNTSKMAENHALCYSFINESNPGTVLIDNKKEIIISIKDFNPEAVTAVAPYNLYSYSRKNTTTTYRPEKFYTADNLPNQVRNIYSEIVIEIQDVSENITKYQKIQPASIICFEEIDENSINAAIELSNGLGKIVPIELIDRRELANQVKLEINDLFEKFKNEKNLQPKLIEQIIIKFNNVRNAHMYSNFTDELIGERNEENLNAPFNKIHLNKILLECINIIEQKIKEGQIEEGLKAIEEIKQFIKNEQEKNMIFLDKNNKLALVDLNIDYDLDEIYKIYNNVKISTDTIGEATLNTPISYKNDAANRIKADTNKLLEPEKIR